MQKKQKKTHPNTWNKPVIPVDSWFVPLAQDTKSSCSQHCFSLAANLLGRGCNFYFNDKIWERKGSQINAMANMWARNLQPWVSRWSMRKQISTLEQNEKGQIKVWSTRKPEPRAGPWCLGTENDPKISMEFSHTFQWETIKTKPIVCNNIVCNIIICNNKPMSMPTKLTAWCNRHTLGNLL